MEIISRLNPSQLFATDQSAGQPRATEQVAAAVAQRAASQAVDTDASRFASRLLEVRDEATALQGRLSQTQAEQNALTAIREALVNRPDPTQLGQQLQQVLGSATYNSEPVTDITVEQALQNPQGTAARIDTRLQELQAQSTELTAGLTQVMVKAENILAAAGPAAASGSDVSSLIQQLSSLSSNGQALFSGLTPEGVGSLL